MPAVGYDSTRPRNNRAGNAFAVRTVKLMGKCDHWWNGDGVERSTPRRMSVVQRGGDTLFVLHSPIDKSAEVRTGQTLWNRIKFVGRWPRRLALPLQWVGRNGTNQIVWKSI